MSVLNEDQSIRKIPVLCLDISAQPRCVQLIILSSLVFLYYLVYGYFLELIFRAEGFREFGWYLTLIQFACYITMALVERLCSTQSSRKIPLMTYGFIAFLTVATMGLSNSSVGYLNYPTQVIFKSCKLIPVLVGGIVIQGKMYGLVDVLACGFMSLGLIFFTLADSSVSPAFNTYGIILVSLALCADAVIGNVQEKTMRQYESSSTEMVLYSYSIGFFYILFGVIITGEIVPAFHYCAKNLETTYLYAVIMSMCGYLGVSMVLHLIQHFGALLAVTVTTCRKAVTIVLSFTFFTKPFTIRYLWAGSLVMLGIYLHVASKRHPQWSGSIRRLVDKLPRICNVCRRHSLTTSDEIV